MFRRDNKKFDSSIAAPFDPGWNDPPTFNYSNAPPPTKTKLNLNKRIAFPIQSSSPSSAELPKVESSGAGLPMPFARVKLNVNESNTAPVISNIVPLQPPPSMTSVPKSSESDKELNCPSTVTETNDLRNSQELVMNTLREVNESLISTDSVKVEEIEKRINVLEAMWIDGKIDDKLKALLLNTAKGDTFLICFYYAITQFTLISMEYFNVTALRDNEFSAAINLQRSIIVDHGSNVCAQWGPALRQLILLKENQIAPKTESISDASIVDEPKFINPLDDQSCGSSKTVGRVKHL